MSVSVSDIITQYNKFIGDSSTNRVTAADRLDYITEAVIWLQEELKNDHQIRTYVLSYIDTVNYYQVTTPLADLLDGADLRRRVGQNFITMEHKSSRQLSEDISQGIVGDDAWAIQRDDTKIELAINAVPQNRAIYIDTFDGGVGSWTADAVTSDATNVVTDVNEFFGGSASLSFDIDVSQSGNNRATITNTVITQNLSSMEQTGTLLIDAYISDATYIVSYTLFWGSDSSNYYSYTVTTDINGNALAKGWQTLAFDWTLATKTGTPVTTALDYWRIDMNYSASQGNATKFRYDTFRAAKPEALTFYYVSWNVGTDSGGNQISKFSSTADIPFFSGKYDQYKVAVAHWAAALTYYALRLPPYAKAEEDSATKALERARRIFPQSLTKEQKSFKIRGLNLARQNVGFSNINNVQR